MTSVRASIDQHPDLLALRENYERAAQSVMQGAKAKAQEFVPHREG